MKTILIVAKWLCFKYEVNYDIYSCIEELSVKFHIGCIWIERYGNGFEIYNNESINGYLNEFIILWIWNPSLILN